MPILPALPDLVPFEEVAEILQAAMARLPGGPPALLGASSRHLAAALDAAGFVVIRATPPGRQLTL